MITENKTFLSLGLRSSGKYELVEKSTGRVSFSDVDLSDGLPIDLVVNPLDTSFAERPRSFLSNLRETRKSLLTKKSHTKGETDAASPSSVSGKSNRRTTPSKSKSKPIPQTVESNLLSSLGANGQALLEMLKRNVQSKR